MSQPLATCQCQKNLAAPCGAPATQEDLLCDLCRQARRTPGTVCAVVTIPGRGSRHLAFFSGMPLMPGLHSSG
jgi:hypothetical protein